MKKKVLAAAVLSAAVLASCKFGDDQTPPVIISSVTEAETKPAMTVQVVEKPKRWINKEAYAASLARYAAGVVDDAPVWEMQDETELAGGALCVNGDEDITAIESEFLCDRVFVNRSTFDEMNYDEEFTAVCRVVRQGKNHVESRWMQLTLREWVSEEVMYYRLQSAKWTLSPAKTAPKLVGELAAVFPQPYSRGDALPSEILPYALKYCGDNALILPFVESDGELIRVSGEGLRRVIFALTGAEADLEACREAWLGKGRMGDSYDDAGDEYVFSAASWQYEHTAYNVSVLTETKDALIVTARIKGSGMNAEGVGEIEMEYTFTKVYENGVLCYRLASSKEARG